MFPCQNVQQDCFIFQPRFSRSYFRISLILSFCLSQNALACQHHRKHGLYCNLLPIFLLLSISTVFCMPTNTNKQFNLTEPALIPYNAVRNFRLSAAAVESTCTCSLHRRQSHLGITFLVYFLVSISRSCSCVLSLIFWLYLFSRPFNSSDIPPAYGFATFCRRRTKLNIPTGICSCGWPLH